MAIYFLYFNLRPYYSLEMTYNVLCDVTYTGRLHSILF